MSDRKNWQPQEDLLIRQYLQQHSNSDQSRIKWTQVAKQINQTQNGIQRSGKQCRQRWCNQLNPQIKKNTEWSQQQERILFQAHDELGNKWAQIAQRLEGRTDNIVKNHYYSALRKGLRRINKYITQCKKKQSIKPFKQQAMTKVLAVADGNYDNKLQVKQTAVLLASTIKNQLIQLSSLRDDQDILALKNVKQVLIVNFQQFTRNCKRRKGKKKDDYTSSSYIGSDQYSPMDIQYSNKMLSSQNSSSVLNRVKSEGNLFGKKQELFQNSSPFLFKNQIALPQFKSPCFQSQTNFNQNNFNQNHNISLNFQQNSIHNQPNIHTNNFNVHQYNSTPYNNQNGLNNNNTNILIQEHQEKPRGLRRMDSQLSQLSQEYDKDKGIFSKNTIFSNIKNQNNNLINFIEPNGFAFFNNNNHNNGNTNNNTNSNNQNNRPRLQRQNSSTQRKPGGFLQTIAIVKRLGSRDSNNYNSNPNLISQGQSLFESGFFQLPILQKSDSNRYNLNNFIQSMEFPNKPNPLSMLNQSRGFGTLSSSFQFVNPLQKSNQFNNNLQFQDGRGQNRDRFNN